MNLQLALIFLGFVLIVIIYVVSKFSDKKSSDITSKAHHHTVDAAGNESGFAADTASSAVSDGAAAPDDFTDEDITASDREAGPGADASDQFNAMENEENAGDGNNEHVSDAVSADREIEILDEIVAPGAGTEAIGQPGEFAESEIPASQSVEAVEETALGEDDYSEPEERTGSELREWTFEPFDEDEQRPPLDADDDSETVDREDPPGAGTESDSPAVRIQNKESLHEDVPRQENPHGEIRMDAGMDERKNGDEREMFAEPASDLEKIEDEDVGSGDSSARLRTETAPGAPSQPFDSVSSGNQYHYPDVEGFDRISQIDYWVKFSGEKDVGRESVLAQYREHANAISKACQIYGLKIPEKNWCLLEREAEDARFGDLVVTIQLADQNGPVGRDDLDKFITLADTLSRGIGREHIFMAPVDSALRQGDAISKFIRYYESVFVINIRPLKKAYFDGMTVSRCAAQLGLEQSSKNYYVRNKSVGKDKVGLYYLANMSDTGEFDFENMKNMRVKGVTFFTKPAVNRSPGAVFAEMVDTGKAFAARAKGEAVYPGRQDLSQDEEVNLMRQSIEKVAREMEQMGIAPGSEEARRIF